MEEEWKSLDLVGCPNYAVSTHGRVKNMKHDRLMKPSTCDDYLCVTLCDSDKKASEFRVSRLVALAFSGTRVNRSYNSWAY